MHSNVHTPGPQDWTVARKAEKDLSMDDLQGAIETLEYFNEQVGRLAALSFTKYLTEHSISTPNLLEGQDFSIDSAEPNLEATEAFVLTLRFFVQDNEPISIRNIARLYESLPVSDEIKALVQEVRSNLLHRLESFTPLALEGQRLRYSEIFDTLLNGWLAHGRDKAKREKATRWKAHPRRFAYVRALFIMTLMDYVETLYWLRDFNEDAMAELRTQGDSE
jgi:hypothetical protein